MQEHDFLFGVVRGMRVAFSGTQRFFVQCVFGSWLILQCVLVTEAISSMEFVFACSGSCVCVRANCAHCVLAEYVRHAAMNRAFSNISCAGCDGF